MFHFLKTLLKLVIGDSSNISSLGQTLSHFLQLIACVHSPPLVDLLTFQVGRHPLKNDRWSFPLSMRVWVLFGYLDLSKELSGAKTGLSTLCELWSLG